MTATHKCDSVSFAPSDASLGLDPYRIHPWRPTKASGLSHQQELPVGQGVSHSQALS